MKFRPLHDRVVVKRIDAEEKTSGGTIPDSAQENRARADVAAGPGGRDEAAAHPLDVKVGDARCSASGRASGQNRRQGSPHHEESDIMGGIAAAPPPEEGRLATLVPEACHRQASRDEANQVHPSRRRARPSGYGRLLRMRIET
jgi:chaperonin GroES